MYDAWFTISWSGICTGLGDDALCESSFERVWCCGVCSASVELSRMVGVLALRVIIMELWRRRLCHWEGVAAIPPVGSSVDLDDVESWLVALPSYSS